ncbi:Heterokaryon incompatibility protein (HET) domain containing protein [Naviculisporaceae sp. PSN 640]
MGHFLRRLIHSPASFWGWLSSSLTYREGPSGYQRAGFQLDRDLLLNYRDPCGAATGCFICPLQLRDDSTPTQEELSSIMSKVWRRNMFEDLSNEADTSLSVTRRNHAPIWLKTVQITKQTYGSWTSLAIQHAKVTGNMTLRPGCTDGRFQRVIVPYGAATYGYGRQMSHKLNPDLIYTWLETCYGNHGGACNRSALGNYPSGLLLVDVNNWCIVPVDTLSFEPRYAALSYVWGSTRQPQLSLSTEWVWRKSQALRGVRLPPTIVDAISLTQKIGLGFLWVDSICIVQDHPTDKALHIKQMHRIYSHAALTIAATTNNCWQGLYGMSKSLTDVPDTLPHYGLLPGPWILPGDPGYILRPLPEPDNKLENLRFIEILQDPGHWLATCLWRTRGWTFQEEICSKRVVYLLPNNVLFRCQQSTWRADVHLENVTLIGTNPTTSPNDSSITGFIQLDAVRDLIANPYIDDEDIIESFQALVHAYISRRLTRADDIENAFAGVAAMIEPRLGPLFHGIPEKFFGQVLEGCWYWDVFLNRRDGGTPVPFPSWSWTGWILDEKYPEIGIKAVTPYNHAKSTRTLLKFYKFTRDEVKPLFTEGHSRSTSQENQNSSSNPSTALSSSFLKFSPKYSGDVPAALAVSEDTKPHFTPDSEEVFARHKKLLSTQGVKSQDCIAFFTSMTYLVIDTFLPGGVDPHAATREFPVCDPLTKKTLTRIRLRLRHFVNQRRPHTAVAQAQKESWRDANNSSRFQTHPFIVISSIEKAGRRGTPHGLKGSSGVRTSYRLMMIEFNDGIAYKVNVTSPGTLVSEQDWSRVGSRRQLIVMG